MLKFKLNIEYHKIQEILLVILLVYLPFNAISQTVFTHKLGFGFLTFAKEIILLIILSLNILALLNYDRFKSFFSRYRWVIAIVGIYVLWILSSIFWTENLSIKSFIYGWKYDGFFILCLLTGLTLPEAILNKLSKIIKTVVYAIMAALTLGLFLHFVIGPENLTWLGYRNDWSTFISDQALAFCQKIEHSGICRFQGTFSGPNQAGANILLAIAGVFSIFTIKKKRYLYGFLAVLILALVLTFSRSAWLAFVAFTGLLLWKQFENLKVKKIIYAVIVSLAVIGVVVVMAYPETVFRINSNADRVQLYVNSVDMAKNSLLIGNGIGFSGPASHFSDNVIITENWFLQVLLNYGLIGLLFFLALYFTLVNRLLKSEYFHFGLLMLAILIPLNLLHYFEDSSFTYSLFIILGMIIADQARISENRLELN